MSLYLIKFQIKCEWMDSTTSHVFIDFWISQMWTISFTNLPCLIDFANFSTVSCNKLCMFDGFLNLQNLNYSFATTSYVWTDFSDSQSWIFFFIHQIPHVWWKFPMFERLFSFPILKYIFLQQISRKFQKIRQKIFSFPISIHFPFNKFPTTSHGLMDSSVSHLKFILHPSK